ncbi:MAG: VanZ family protein [Tissierellia bacterium]|nr:VanZ family protein [Tissierellia bacterium]
MLFRHGLLFLSVETLQYFIGRTADVDDLILNVLGVALGWITIRLCQFFLSL